MYSLHREALPLREIPLPSLLMQIDEVEMDNVGKINLFDEER